MDKAAENQVITISTALETPDAIINSFNPEGKAFLLKTIMEKIPVANNTGTRGAVKTTTTKKIIQIETNNDGGKIYSVSVLIDVDISNPCSIDEIERVRGLYEIDFFINFSEGESRLQVHKLERNEIFRLWFGGCPSF